MSVTLALFALFALLAGSARAAGRTPAFTLGVSSQPTNLVPGSSSTGKVQRPNYHLVVSNTGSADTSGPITITDTLPAGITPTAAFGDDLLAQDEFPCDVSGQTVTCTSDFSLQTGQYLHVLIALDVSAGAPSSVVNRATVGGGGGETVSRETTTTVSATPAPFDFLDGLNGLSTTITDTDGSAVTQAGSHPYQLTADFGISSYEPGSLLLGTGPLRDVKVKLPEGVIVDPSATPVLCTEAQLESDASGGGCPDASQVGVVAVTTYLGYPLPYLSPLYNMDPPPGVPAALAFDAVGAGIYVHLLGGVDASGNYALTSDSKDILARTGTPVYGVRTQLWGDPSDASHDKARGVCVFAPNVDPNGFPCPAVPRIHAPLLTMPGACSGPLITNVAIDSWTDPGNFRTRDAQTTDANGTPVGVSGCSRLHFDPTITAQPAVSVADSPTGLHVDLKVPQTNDLSSLATANLKDAVVTLPAGVSLSPSAADGLAACSPAQIGLGTSAQPTCPDAAKIGTVEVDTPLLKDPLKGSVFVAAQNDNPSHSILGIYVTAEGSGVVIKLAGHVRADKDTGQLTTTFENNPQLPFSEFKLDFGGGPRAALATPDGCGTYQTASSLTPWNGAAAVTGSDPFSISSGCSGGFAPTAMSGSVNPTAGAHSDFTLRLDRPDGQQHVKTVVANLAPGILANVGSVALCADADAAAGSCGSASQVGSTDSAAGPGSTPFHLPGKVFLTGPYKGAPYGLSIVVPAIAGPFNLGTVVVRGAIHVDPLDAHVTVVSDDVPKVLDVQGADGDINGFPLRIRSIVVAMNRPDFMLNPTSCAAMSLTGTIGSWEGSTAPVSNRFQVGDCTSLSLAPKLAITLTGKGQTTDDKHPGVHAVLTQTPGLANLKKVEVTLPLSLALDPDNAQALCEFADGSKVEPTCPKASIVGHVTAESPILDGPLTGPVYFVKNIRVDAKTGRQIRTLPKLVIPLTGPNGLRLNLTGLSSVPDNKHLVSTFDLIPDAPVSKFTLDIDGGKHGILVVSGANICKSTQKATQEATGQNGKVTDATITMGTPCTLGITASTHTSTALKLTVGGLGAGKVAVSGNAITKTSRTIASATSATLTAKLTRAARAALAHHRNVTVRLTISFTPKGAKKAKVVHKTLTIHGASRSVKK